MKQPVLVADSFLDRAALVLAKAAEAPDDASAAAVAQFIGLCSTPQYQSFAPRRWLAGLSDSLGIGGVEVAAEPTEECVADLEKLPVLLRMAVGGIVLEDDAAVVLEVFQEVERRKPVPRIGLGLSGSGRIPPFFELEGRVRLSQAELSDCWTLATRSGRIDAAPNGLDLRLKGERVTPDPLQEADALLSRLPDFAAALAFIEGPDKREPADVSRLFADVEAAYAAPLAQASIRCESLPAQLPLIQFDRSRLRRFFMAVFEYTMWNVLRGGTISWLFEYLREAREVSLLASVQGVQLDTASFHNALMRRVIAELHGGRFDYSASGGQAMFTATLPDRVGAVLDDWLPGWEAFGDQSQQFLRLLKSGGAAPPEEFILGGILDQELTAWLMPRLALPLAHNVAGEIRPKKQELPESHLERLQKALQQIAKGKPKKEITSPAYAGELVYAFRGSERARTALGTEPLSDEELRALTQALLSTPPRALEALRLLARVLGR